MPNSPAPSTAVATQVGKIGDGPGLAVDPQARRGMRPPDSARGIGVDRPALRLRQEASDGAEAKDIYIAQTYAFGEEAQVDWYEAYANFGVRGRAAPRRDSINSRGLIPARNQLMLDVDRRRDLLAFQDARG